MFVPPGWAHSVINVQPNIKFAFDFAGSLDHTAAALPHVLYLYSRYFAPRQRLRHLGEDGDDETSSPKTKEQRAAKELYDEHGGDYCMIRDATFGAWGHLYNAATVKVRSMPIS